MRYFIIAGERSGDLHAGNLARALKEKDSEAVMAGFGGDYMASVGVNVSVHYREMAVMGFWEVLISLRKINTYLNRCKQEIGQFKPDVVVLVDYGGFNKRIASWAKENGYRTFYYISPKVWAWNQNRAWKLKKVIDRMFVILPFEKDFYKKFDWEVDYVGNPVLDAVKAHVSASDFRQRHGIPSSSDLVALLPGSRKQELDNVLPLMAETVRAYPDVHFAVAAIDTFDKSVYASLQGLPNLSFIFEETYDLLCNSKAAMVTSGTATLETALFRVPQVVVYKTSVVSYRIAKWLIKVPFISLVNLVAGREVVRELIQDDYNLENVKTEIRELLSGPKRERILRDYDEIYTLLDIGSASGNAARLMVERLHKVD